MFEFLEGASTKDGGGWWSGVGTMEFHIGSPRCKSLEPRGCIIDPRGSDCDHQNAGLRSPKEPL